MVYNFFVWLIPGSIILGISVLIILILLTAAADIHGGANKKDPFKKWPKGLVGFLGIGYLLTSITSILLIFIISDINTEGTIILVFSFLVFGLLGYWGTRYDYRRLIRFYDPSKDK